MFVFPFFSRLECANSLVFVCFDKRPFAFSHFLSRAKSLLEDTFRIQGFNYDYYYRRSEMNFTGKHTFYSEFLQNKNNVIIKNLHNIFII